MIEITVNGESVEIDAPMTVEQMLDTVDVPPNYLAVEVNGDVCVDSFLQVRFLRRFSIDALVAQLAPPQTGIVEIAEFE